MYRNASSFCDKADNFISRHRIAAPGHANHQIRHILRALYDDSGVLPMPANRLLVLRRFIHQLFFFSLFSLLFLFLLVLIKVKEQIGVPAQDCAALGDLCISLVHGGEFHFLHSRRQITCADDLLGIVALLPDIFVQRIFSLGDVVSLVLAFDVLADLVSRRGALCDTQPVCARSG